MKERVSEFIPNVEEGEVSIPLASTLEYASPVVIAKSMKTHFHFVSCGSVKDCSDLVVDFIKWRSTLPDLKPVVLTRDVVTRMDESDYLFARKLSGQQCFARQARGFLIVEVGGKYFCRKTDIGIDFTCMLECVVHAQAVLYVKDVFSYQGKQLRDFFHDRVPAIGFVADKLDSCLPYPVMDQYYTTFGNISDMYNSKTDRGIVALHKTSLVGERESLYVYYNPEFVCLRLFSTGANANSLEGNTVFPSTEKGGHLYDLHGHCLGRMYDAADTDSHVAICRSIKKFGFRPLTRALALQSVVRGPKPVSHLTYTLKPTKVCDLVVSADSLMSDLTQRSEVVKNTNQMYSKVNKELSDVKKKLNGGKTHNRILDTRTYMQLFKNDFELFRILSIQYAGDSVDEWFRIFHTDGYAKFVAACSNRRDPKGVRKKGITKKCSSRRYKKKQTRGRPKQYSGKGRKPYRRRI